MTQVQGSKQNIKENDDDSLLKYGQRSLLGKDEKDGPLASATSKVQWSLCGIFI